MTDLTRPENAAELTARRRVLADLLACGGCARCAHRDRSVLGWGRSVCRVPGRAFPRCAEDGQSPGFEFDRGE